MFGIVLAGIGNFFAEIAESIGKKEGHDKVASVYTLSFISLFEDAQMDLVYAETAMILHNDFLQNNGRIPILRLVYAETAMILHNDFLQNNGRIPILPPILPAK